MRNLVAIRSTTNVIKLKLKHKRNQASFSLKVKFVNTIDLSLYSAVNIFGKKKTLQTTTTTTFRSKLKLIFKYFGCLFCSFWQLLLLLLLMLFLIDVNHSLSFENDDEYTSYFRWIKSRTRIKKKKNEKHSETRQPQQKQKNNTEATAVTHTLFCLLIAYQNYNQNKIQKNEKNSIKIEIKKNFHH